MRWQMRRGAMALAVRGGLAAGAIDILYALAANGVAGVAPLKVLQSVAGGLLGAAAYRGGIPAACLGLLLHFGMTIAMAWLFTACLRRFPPLQRHAVPAGAAYGAIIYFAMRWVVVPLSAFPGDLRTFNALELAVHVLGVGVVIALFAARRPGPRPRAVSASAGR